MRAIRLLTEARYYRWLLFGLVLAGGISFFVAFYLVWAGPLRALFPDPLYYPGRDFNPPYATALAFSEGQDPGSLSFVYFPLTIFFYLPLSHLSFYQAYIVMTIWNLMMALILAIVATKILKYYGIMLPAAAKWFFFLACIFFCPVTADLISANVNTFVACFCALFYYFLFVKQKNLYAALCLAVATLFKIFPAFLILLAIVGRRYKFVLMYVALLVVCLVSSILLLGVPAHVNWIKFLFTENQGVSALTYGHNSTITAILYKSLQLFGIEGAGQNNVISIGWLVVRLALIALTMYYLFPIFGKKGEATKDNRWTILSFSLFSVLMISLPNTAWVYYASCLVLPFILCIFCLNLSLLDKVILALSLAFYSFNTHIHNLAIFMGGTVSSIAYVLHPSVVGNILFIAFILLYMVRLSRKRYYPQPEYIDTGIRNVENKVNCQLM